MQSERPWWYAWPRRIACGAMIHGRRPGEPGLYGQLTRTVGTILTRHGIAPAPRAPDHHHVAGVHRTHMDVLVATDFCTAEVWTLGGLVTYDVCFHPPWQSESPCDRRYTPSP